MKKNVNFDELKKENIEYLKYTYHKKMLESEEGHLAIKLDPNDRVSNLNNLRSEFEKENIKVDEDGETFIEVSPNFFHSSGYDLDYYHASGMADMEIKILVEEVLADIYDVVKYEKQEEGKELSETQAINLLNELCNIYHRYNDEDYNKTLVKIAALADDTMEMEKLYFKAHEAKIFNSPLLGNKKYLLENVFMDNEIYNAFNKDIKNELKNTFYNDVLDKVHMIAVCPSKLKNEESQFLLDILQDRRFNSLDASKHSGFIPFEKVLDKAFDRIKKEQGEDMKPYFVQFNALVKTGLLENIVQYNNYAKSLENSLERLNAAFYWGSENPETERLGDELTNKARKYVVKILENKKIDDELKKAPEKNIKPFRFRN